MQNKYTSEILVVLLHGWAINIPKYCSLKEAILETYPDAKIIAPKMNLSVFSCANPNEIVNNVLLQIDDFWESVEITNRKSLKIILSRFPLSDESEAGFETLL